MSLSPQQKRVEIADFVAMLKRKETIYPQGKGSSLRNAITNASADEIRASSAAAAASAATDALTANTATVSRSATLPEPSDEGRQIARVARRMLAEDGEVEALRLRPDAPVGFPHRFRLREEVGKRAGVEAVTVKSLAAIVQTRAKAISVVVVEGDGEAALESFGEGLGDGLGDDPLERRHVDRVDHLHVYVQDRAAAEALAADIGIDMPVADYKAEGVHGEKWSLPAAAGRGPIMMGADRFCDGRTFDPARPLERQMKREPAPHRRADQDYRHVGLAVEDRQRFA